MQVYVLYKWIPCVTARTAKSPFNASDLMQVLCTRFVIHFLLGKGMIPMSGSDWLREGWKLSVGRPEALARDAEFTPRDVRFPIPICTRCLFVK